MFSPYFSITPKITSDLEAIGAVLGYFKAVKLPENYKKELVSKVTAETVHSSTAIEGNTLTQGQVDDVLRGKTIVAEKDDIKEVVNYNRALEYVEILAKENTLVTENLIREINAIVLKDIRSGVGRYRTTQVVVGDYVPPEHWQVPILMREFVDWLREPQPAHLSPILYTGIAHYQLVAIHPFEDGNGRTTRILTTLMLIQYGYEHSRFFSLESYYNRNRKAYYEALGSADKYRVGEKADLTRWLEYYVEGVLIEATRAKSGIEEMLERAKLTATRAWLSDVQRRMLKLTREKGSAKTADYLQVARLSRKGTYNALTKLVELGLLKRTGAGKGSYYTITEKGLNQTGSNFQD